MLELLRGAQFAQAEQGGVNDRDMVLRTHRLGKDVVNAGRLEDRTDAAAGDDAGTGAGRTEENLAAVVFTENLVRNRGPFELNGDHVLAGVFGTLADRIGHFVGLAVADADRALTIADDGEGGEAKAATALDDFGATIDENDLFD